LFDRFSPSASDAPSNGREQGSGLGMALCKDLVKLLGGHIHASSTPGVGTIVEVTLPTDPETRHDTPA
jgi:signal transduction histidine kinase